MAWNPQAGYGGGVVPPKGKGKQAQWKGWENKGIPELESKLLENIAAVAGADPTIPQTVQQMIKKINKLAEKYREDERAKQKGSTTAAKLLIEEFVEHMMGAIESCCYEGDGLKDWFMQVNFTQPLLSCVLWTFSSAKIFNRTLKPTLLKYIEEGLFRWGEEKRITEGMSNVVKLSAIEEGFHKKANQHLTKSYDLAHFTADFGKSTAPEGEIMGLLQDFVKGWMKEFCDHAWDVLENGLPDPSKEGQISQITVLFQNLLHPQNAIIPVDIATEMAQAGLKVPDSPWPYIDEAAIALFKEREDQEAQAAANKKRKMDMGARWGKGK